MPCATRALREPLHCLNMVQNKGQLLSLFASDEFELFLVKQGRSGKKGRAAVKVANQLKSWVEDNTFWDILTEAYKVLTLNLTLTLTLTLTLNR